MAKLVTSFLCMCLGMYLENARVYLSRFKDTVSYTQFMQSLQQNKQEKGCLL